MSGETQWTRGISTARYNAWNFSVMTFKRASALIIIAIAWCVSFQVIMKACSGINYGEFASFLKIIANNRMAFLNACSSGDSSDYSRHLSEILTTLGPYHAAFDLQRVAHIIECLLCNEDFKRLDHSTLTLQPETMLQQIRDTIQSTRGQHLLYQE